jgi:MtN3 and saliva related transmembrane protein
MVNYIELIGLAACLCTTLSALPQIIKIIKLKSAKDLSLLTYLLSCTGVALWLIYGILLSSLSLIASNVICLFFQITIIIMIIKSNNQHNNS